MRASAAGGLFWVAWAVSLKSPAPLGRPGPDPCSPKWLPQAPSKATTENSAYHRDWRSPGAPITSKRASGLDGVHISTKTTDRNCWTFFQNLRASAAGGPFWVAWVVSLRPKWASRLDGVHVSTKTTDPHLWAFSKNMRASAAGGLFGVAWVLSLKSPAPLGRPVPKRHPRGTLRTRSGSSGVVEHLRHRADESRSPHPFGPPGEAWICRGRFDEDDQYSGN